MEKKGAQVSIIGCGSVGVRYAYALAIKRAARRIVMVDLDRKRLDAEVLDLSHGAPFIAPVEFVAGGYPEIAGSDLVVITAGKKQKPGQSRIDLARDNVDLFRSIVPSVMEHAPDAVLLVVSNPVDILAYVAFRFSGKPAGEVIGSGTVLDSARFRYLLARHCGVDPRNVHAYILGEHGDSEFAVWSRVMIGGVLFNEYCPACNRRTCCRHDGILNKIFTEVRNSAYRIIEAKGETSYGIGLSLVRITQAVINDEKAVLPVSVFLDDYMGFSDLYMSIPSIVGGRGVSQTLRLGLDEKEAAQLRESAAVLRGVITECGL